MAGFTSGNLQREVSVFHVDFEISMHTILKEFFPTATIKGCRFHLGQAWWRKSQNIRLGNEYKDKGSEVGK